MIIKENKFISLVYAYCIQISPSHCSFHSEAQLMIGGLVKDPNVLLAFTESTPYLNDDHAWCLKRASQSVSWENIFNVFQLNLWIAFIATFIMMSVGLYIFIYVEDVQKNFYWALLRGLSLSLGIPPFLWRTKSFSVRLIIFVFFTYGVIITAVFSSFLVNALTKQRFNKQIDSINETIRHNFYYAGGPVVFDSLATRGDAVSIQIDVIYPFNPPVHAQILTITMFWTISDVLDDT